MPSSFFSGQPPDIVAPMPRPPRSPSWLNPGAALEGAIAQQAAGTGDGEDLPPLRFGRGERPDAEDEPESEDEFVPGRQRDVRVDSFGNALGVSSS